VIDSEKAAGLPEGNVSEAKAFQWDLGGTQDQHHELEKNI
jgi:hypothetical protein